MFPEVSRSRHFGKKGTHLIAANDPFYNDFLANTVLNVDMVDWTTLNLTYLLQANYQDLMDQWLSQAIPFNNSAMGDLHEYCDKDKSRDDIATSDLLVTYEWGDNNHKGFVDVANKLQGVVNDIRGQRPRASYNGVVVVRCRGRRLFLKPHQ